MKRRKKGAARLLLRLLIVAMVAVVGFQLMSSRGNALKGEAAVPLVSAPSESFIDGFFTTPDGQALEYTRSIRLSSTGDIMTHGTQIKGAYDSSTGTYDFKLNFIHVKKYFEQADVALANFETVTAGGAPQGYPVFNAPDEIVDAVKYAGFELLGTANNHSLDKGKNGLLRTLDQLQARGLVSTGTFREPEDQITYMEENGIRVGFLAYTYGLNGLDGYLSQEERSYMINLIDEEKIREDIQKAKDQGCDAIAVIIHWGNEYQLTQNSMQTELAQKIFAWGADVILGSHPHVIQPSQIIEVDGETKYVIYSQGNFLSNQRRETLTSISAGNYTEDGVIVHLSLEKDMIRNTVRIQSVSYTPTWVYRYASSAGQLYEILPVNEALRDGQLPDWVQGRLKESLGNTMDKMTMFNGDLDG